MDSRVDIFRLETGHTYQIVRSKKDTDLFDYVRDQTGSTRTYLLARPALIAQRPPPKLSCWSDLEDYQPPRGQSAASKWMVFAHGDDGLALGLNGPLTPKERDQLLSDVELVSVQRAQAGASKDDIGNRLAGMAMTVIIGLAVLVTLIIVLVGVSGFFASRGGDNPAEPTEYVVEPPPPDAPVGEWQNPRPAP